MNKHLSKQEIYKVVLYLTNNASHLKQTLELKLEIKKNRQNDRAEAKTEGGLETQVHQMKILTGEILSAVVYAASRIPLMPWS